MRFLIIFLILILNLPVQAQTELLNDQTIQLASSLRTYKNREELKGFMKSLNAVTAPELTFTKSFVIAAVQGKRFLLEKDFLEVQGDQDLLYCYTVIQLSNYFDITDKEKNKLTLNQLINRPKTKIEHLTTYYDFLFNQVIYPTKDYGYKNQRFFFNDMALKTNQERGLFFLIAMSHYRKLIVRPLKAESPPDIESAYNWLIYFPSFENKPYYYYTDLDIEDFKLTGLSFKSSMMPQYYDLLLEHLFTLKEHKVKQAKIDDLLYNSILLKKELYQFASKATREVLEDLYENTNASKPVTSEDATTSLLDQGKSFIQQKEFAKAISVLTTATSQSPKDVKLQQALGLAYQQSGDHQSASKVFQRIVDLVPASPAGYYGLGTSQFEQGQYTDALKTTKKALSRFEELNPTEMYKALGLMGMIYSKLKDSKNAKSYLKKAQKSGFEIPEGF